MAKLSAQAKVPYSDAERELFDLLPVGGRNAISSADIANKRYGATAPFHALAIIRATIGNLTRKIEINNEPFRIEKTGRSGPHHIQFWIAPKKGKQ